MGTNPSKSKASFDDDCDVDFDHFQILRAIGKGSFGKVCIVQKKDTKRMYAMKYVNKSHCVLKEATRNVMREIEILTTLDHPFLVNLWFSFQDEEDMFMVVDLLLGGDLRYHMQQDVKFEEPCVKLYITELALALDYLRIKRIVHRDIKPDNILLDEEGHVHITDFNIATVLDEGQLATSMSGTKPYIGDIIPPDTRPGVDCTRVSFSAPEVFDCAVDKCKGYRHPVDWWSLGVCAYEMLRGKRPFDIHAGTSVEDVRRMFALYDVNFPCSASDLINDLLTKLICVDPARRVSSLGALRQHPYMMNVDYESILKRKIKPSFVPPKDHLNCDPTFELEEMIIEAKPLHKKKKRLSKQNSKRERPGATRAEGEGTVQHEFRVYNREKELKRRDMERKENEWQAELDRHILGTGSGVASSNDRKEQSSLASGMVAAAVAVTAVTADCHVRLAIARKPFSSSSSSDR